MRVHYLQHVPFEGLGSIEEELNARGIPVTSTRLYRNEALPSPTSIDLLIIMGGPMGVYDTEKYPWLNEEKTFIKAVIDQGARVLGICLGAQLIASALGAKVYQGRHREIGWFPVNNDSAVASSAIAEIFPASFNAFHWHGDTFDIPAGATPLGSSGAFENQGFILEDRVIALQFHPETTPESARLLVEHCSDELDGTAYVQSGNRLLANQSAFSEINSLMEKIVAYLTR